MKKIILLLFIIMATVILNTNQINAQTDNSWVLPFITNTPQYEANRLEFGESIQTFTLQNITYGYPFKFSAGGYDTYGNLLFYMLEFKVYAYHNGESSFVENIESTSASPAPEMQIINKPESNNHFYIIYSLTGGGGNQDHQFYFVEVTVNQNPYEVIISDRQFINTCSEPNWGGFAVTREVNGKRKLFTCSGCGIMETEINATGFSNTPILILENNFGEHKSLDAFNFEMKTDNNCDTVFAWFTRYFNPAESDTVYIYNMNTEELKKIDLNTQTTGHISGIEFSAFEDDILYISYDADNSSAAGIYKLNYETETAVMLTQGEQYAHTFLQLAPDGDVYGITQGNESDPFFKIDMTDGSFISEVYDNGQLLSYQGDDAYKTFILPEKDMTPGTLSFTVETGSIACECPEENAYGWAKVNDVQGGCGVQEPFYYIWYDEAGNILLEGEDEDYLDDLPEGTYTVCVSDNGQPAYTGCQTFDIALDEDLYTYDEMVDIWPGTPDWNNLVDVRFRQGIFVHKGADFTIGSSYLEFGPNAKIIVDTGAVLTVDHTTLSSIQQCPCQWKGIEVWGMKEKDQFFFGNSQLWQGKLSLVHATIKDAETAVRLAATDENGNIIYSTTGGYVIANSSLFINNRKSIHALPYENTVSGVIYDNVSKFINCTFKVDENYLYDPDADNKFFKHIDLAQVRGFDFHGCDFLLQTDQGVSDWNDGIAAYDAGFSVLGRCLSGDDPCSDIDSSSFTGFNTAVWASGGGDKTPTFNIEHTLFTDNATGVYASVVNNLAVLFSEFHIGHNDNAGAQAICGSNAASYGIDMNQCTGFAIEENEFYRINTEDTVVGIRCKDSQTDYDLIYKNTLEGLSYGNFAEGMNRSGMDDTLGLEYQCNYNTENYIDFIVTTNDPLVNPQIRTHQGSMYKEAGNTFSTNPLSEGNFENDGNQAIIYFYHNNPPVYYTEYYVVPSSVEGVNTCPSHYGGGGGGGIGIRTVLSPEEKQQAEQDYADNLANYNNVKALYDNLKDGGNTEGTVSDVETAWPDEMWELRAELLGKSPHLSKEVLMAAADKTDVLPESVLFEILSANPDELCKEELINYLENKEQPLPEYMINILKQLAGNITYKTILKSQMSDYLHKKVASAQDIIRSILNDSILDRYELRSWLDNIGGYIVDQQIIASYLQDEKYDSAQTLLNLLPSLYQLEGEDQVAYDDYKAFIEMQINVFQQKRNIFSLGSSELNMLIDLANNGHGNAKTMARGILEYAYDYHYCDCLSVTDSIGLKSSHIIFEDYENLSGIDISIKPNPAKEWVAFSYKLPFNISRANIIITNVVGETVYKIDVNEQQGQKIWDAREISPGTYIYTIQAGNIIKQGKIVIR
jgi:hypothetical protein